MLRRRCILVGLAGFAVAAAFWCACASAQTWTISTLDADGDVGRYADLQVDSDGDLHVLYLRTANPTIKIISEQNGVWGAPQVVDASGAATGPFSLALNASDEGKVSFRRTDHGALGYAGPEESRSWSASAVVQQDDVGRSLTLLMLPDGEIAAAYRNQTAGSLHTIRRSGGVWGAPEVVDPGPGRGTYADIAHRPGVGYAFSEYSPQDGAQLFLDPAIEARSWSIAPATAEVDDVGQNLAIFSASDGTIGASYRNATQGTLQHIRREGSAWTAPVTIDGGVNRGCYSDLARMPDGRYCFSEYDVGHGSLLLAHPDFQARHFSTLLVDGLLKSGRQLSVFQNANGRLDCAYVTEEADGRQKLKAAEIVPGYAYIVRTVADSISPALDATIKPDVAVSGDLDWHISYRMTVPNHLYEASTSNFQLLPADAPEAPQEGEPQVAGGSFLRNTYPNPAPSGFRVQLAAARAGEGTIAVYDIQGRCVRRMAMRCAQGENTVPFDGRTDSGAPLAPGVYFVRVHVGDEDLGQVKLVILDPKS